MGKLLTNRGVVSHRKRICRIAGLLIAVSAFTACANQNVSDIEPPKPWHHPPAQSELWGLKEISFHHYQEIQIGASAALIDKSAVAKNLVCFICWLDRKSYEVCFKVEDGVVRDKSIREVKLTY